MCADRCFLLLGGQSGQFHMHAAYQPCFIYNYTRHAHYRMTVFQQKIHRQAVITCRRGGCLCSSAPDGEDMGTPSPQNNIWFACKQDSAMTVCPPAWPTPRLKKRSCSGTLVLTAVPFSKMISDRFFTAMSLSFWQSNTSTLSGSRECILYTCDCVKIVKIAKVVLYSTVVMCNLFNVRVVKGTNTERCA